MSKCIVVGVTGCVGAFKSVQLVSDLVKKGYDVEVIMTKNATEFIQPLQFESLTQHKVMVDTFDRNFEYSTQHISISKKADLFIVTPATANFIAKAVHGLADDMLSTTFLACDCPKIIAPAMNTKMYLNPITQNNLKLCEQYGFRVLSPVSGHLACGDAGLGKLTGLNEHMDLIEEMLVTEKPLLGKKVLINAGPTLERIDPVRYISNHSSGKMGIALAKAARNMGADVTLVCGPIQLSVPTNIKRIDIESATQVNANTTACNQSSTQDGVSTYTDLEWGGSMFEVPAGKTVVAEVTYDASKTPTNVKIFFDSHTYDDNNAHSGNVTLSNMTLKGEYTPGQKPQEPVTPTYDKLTF